MLWHSEKIEKVLEHLSTTDKGLSDDEARKRLERYGPNELKLNKEPLWKIIIEPFRNIFVAVLLAAATLSVLKNEIIDAVIISFIIIINAVIFYTQKITTSKVLKTLQAKSVYMARVLRNGKTLDTPSAKLVPGDIVLLSEGGQVPADTRIIESFDLQIDESALTGESKPVHKHPGELKDYQRIYEQTNMAFQGTYIVGGSAKALVVSTGTSTQYGQIAHLASQAEKVSPVQQKIDELVGLLIKVIAVASLAVLALGMYRGISSSESLRFALSLAVSAVPEGLPVALSVIIVLGMRRMAKKKALVRSFKAIEDIGLVDTVATDKTGTVTKNNLKVVTGWSAISEPIKKLAGRVVSAVDNTSDPLELALADYTGLVKGSRGQHYPFITHLRLSAVYNSSDKYLYVKGAPEKIISKSKIPANLAEQVHAQLQKFVHNGHRVIGIARLKLSVAPSKLEDIKDSKLEFLGLVAFADEIRPQAKPAIEKAHQAGIDVKLITGDHADTAAHVGRLIGLAGSKDDVMEGTQLPADKASLAKTVQEKTVFARILPKDKFRILEALKSKGRIVAMTGDGVNDVPALANAHVGIAMSSGSDIARDAGGIVLMNNNFATIIKAISEGRRIYDNIRRMVFYVLSTSSGEVITMIGALLLGLPLPVTAIQILWINLVTDTALVLPLGLEPEEPGQMKRPPRDSSDPLLSKIMLQRMLLVAAAMAAVTLLFVFHLSNAGYELAYVQTVAFMGLVVAQWTNAFNARSESESFFSKFKQPNRSMYLGFAIGFLLQMLVMFGPFKESMGIASVPLSTLALASLAMSAAIILVSDLHKLASKKPAKH